MFPIHTASTNRVEDHHLGFRMSTSLDDIDENGFRNDTLLKSADIVTLGDSHTYGYNVVSEDSWPQQVAKMAGKTVYNFGVGGYGILQYYYLLDEAIKLKPDNIILGLYLANDLYDICTAVTEIDYWKEWSKENNFDISSCLNSHNIKRDTNHILSLIENTAIGSMAIFAIWKPMSARVKILFNGNNKMFEGENSDVIISEGMNSNILNGGTIVSHERATNIKKEEINSSFELTKEIMKKAKKKCDKNNIVFSVLFVPSEENAFYNYLLEKGYGLPTAYHNLVSNERYLVDQLSSFFKKEGIKYVDALPYVTKDIYEKGYVYSCTHNGHPLKIGYTAYAKAVYENILQ